MPSPVRLIDYVKALEGKDNRARSQQVMVALAGMGIEPAIQRCRWPRIENIVVDFAPESKADRLLFSAHYDAVRGSPGANDNASGVAVLLGLCQELRQKPAPVTVLFFDREEAWLRTPALRLGLLGSLYYAWKANLRNVAAVYNVEFCGLGDFLAVWPVSDRHMLTAVQAIKAAAVRMGLPFKSASVPWFLFTSDHLSFRLKGISNALTLSLIPSRRVPAMEMLLRDRKPRKFPPLRRSLLPEPLSFMHSVEDTSSRLEEKSLQIMLSLLLDLITTLWPAAPDKHSRHGD